MFITKELLLEKRACTKEFEKFNTIFPDGVELTEEICLKYCLEFHVDWCASVFLPIEKSNEFFALAYKLRAQWFIDTDPAYERYLKNKMSENVDIHANADNTYMMETAPFTKEYAEARARIFYSLLASERVVLSQVKDNI